MMSKETGTSQKGVPRPPPFDSYCPSMSTKLDECVCPKCGSSWPSKAAKNRHLKAHKIKQNEQEVVFDTVEDEFEIEDEVHMSDAISEPMPIFHDMETHLASPFEEVHDEIA